MALPWAARVKEAPQPAYQTSTGPVKMEDFDRWFNFSTSKNGWFYQKKGDFLKLVDGSYHVHSIMIPWFTVVHRNFPQESQLVIFQGKLTTGKNCDLHKLVTFSKFWKKCDFPNGKKKHFCWSGFTCPLGLPMKLAPACIGCDLPPGKRMVNVYIAMDNHIFSGKNHYFYGHFQ